MNQTAALALENRQYLQQALHLTDQLDDDMYGRTLPPVFTSGTGSHIRHVIEYYQCFLAGWLEGRVDYEARARDERIGTSRTHAATVIRGIITRLLEMSSGDMDRTVLIRVENGDSPNMAWAATSVGRELDSLLSHTVHHLALVAFMLRSLGMDPGSELGMAPATLRHVRQNPSCAR